MNDIIKNVDIASLTPFEDHPFKLRDGEELEELMASIKKNKIIEPPSLDLFLQQVNMKLFQVTEGLMS